LGSGPETVDWVIDAHTFFVKELDIYQNGFNLSQEDALLHIDHNWEVKDYR